jgi:hypothetical protein
MANAKTQSAGAGVEDAIGDDTRADTLRRCAKGSAAEAHRYRKTAWAAPPAAQPVTGGTPMPATAITDVAELAGRYADSLAQALGAQATEGDRTEDGFLALIDRALYVFGGVAEIAAPLAEAARALDAFAILGARNTGARRRLIGEADQALAEAAAELTT